MTLPFLSFKDCNVLITGGATGIGRATALAFAEHGATVTLGDVDAQGAAETVDCIRSRGGQALFIETDVSSARAVQTLVARSVERFGRIDCAFNNAGVLPSTLEITEVDEADFDRVIAVDLKGVFLCLKYQITAMLASGGGAIVNTASVAGVIADPGMSAYVAAKHGVVGLSKAAGLEYVARGIRVNALAPGLTETPMTARWLADPQMREVMLAGTPARRAARPQEIASMVLYLCSPAASYVNAQVFLVDSGQTAH